MSKGRTRKIIDFFIQKNKKMDESKFTASRVYIKDIHMNISSLESLVEGPIRTIKKDVALLQQQLDAAITQWADEVEEYEAKLAEKEKECEKYKLQSEGYYKAMEAEKAKVKELEKKLYQKEYREEHKQKLAQQNKEYKEKTKGKGKGAEIVKCPCGKEHRWDNQARHRDSDFHTQWVNDNQKEWEEWQAANPRYKASPRKKK